MRKTEHRGTVPFLWLAIVVLAALLAGAVFLLVRPPSTSNEDAGNEPEQSDQSAQTQEQNEAPVDETEEPGEEAEDTEPETGPLRAKLSDAVAGFEVESWAESAGLLKYGAIEAYEGFYVPLDGEAEEFEPTLIAAGRWDSDEDSAEWLTDWVEEQAVLPAEFSAAGKVPGADGVDVGEYRFFESPDRTEAAVVWTNRDLGLLLVGEPEVVELLFTQLPL